MSANDANSMKIVPVILSGGAGSRLWPLSREAFPKQLLPLTSERSLLQDTAGRIADETMFAPPIVVCNAEHRFVIAEQLRHEKIPDLECRLIAFARYPERPRPEE